MTPAQFVRTKKAVLFDLFQTLTSRESEKNNLPQTSELLGVTREAWYEQIFRNSPERLRGIDTDPFGIMAKMARAIDPSISDITIRTACENRLKIFRRVLMNIPAGNIAALRALRAAGMKTALVSNADVTEIAGWDDSPLKGEFDTEVFSCRVGLIKPEPEIYLYALDKLGVSPDCAVFVGDGGSDELKGARALGIATVLMTGVIEETMPALVAQRLPLADYVIRRIPELIE
ncbi:MAG: hypothetical protein A2Y33_13185 [Spirochaetes bacterium GWF1_51_8]|nr:MAG: hypothetical protein A2Y33_13185 [Spirochaetes bacterium GWF1_51_8]